MTLPRQVRGRPQSRLVAVQTHHLAQRLPLLDRRPGGTPGTPIDVTYDIRWPDDPPVLNIGETLANAVCLVLDELLRVRRAG